MSCELEEGGLKYVVDDIGDIADPVVTGISWSHWWRLDPPLAGHRRDHSDL